MVYDMSIREGVGRRGKEAERQGQGIGGTLQEDIATVILCVHLDISFLSTGIIFHTTLSEEKGHSTVFHHLTHLSVDIQ